NPTAQVGDFADGGREGIVDDDQVVVGVQRQLVGVERSLGLPRSADQLLGERAADREGGRTQSETTQKGTTSRKQKGIAHRGGYLAVRRKDHFRSITSSLYPTVTAASAEGAAACRHGGR